MRKRSLLRRSGLAAFAALAAGLSAAPAPAAEGPWAPSRPIRFVVPFPPGGANDIVARQLAVRLSEQLGQQVVVDNRGGANAIIGTEVVVRAAPDGHTILIIPAGHAINPQVQKKLPYDSVNDFAPIGLIGNGAYVLVTSPATPARNVAELVAWLKARPGQVNFASSGVGNLTHLAAELFKLTAGVDVAHVAYKGGAQAMTDVMGGQVAMFFSTVAVAAPQIRGGKVRAQGVTTARRSQALPDVPTIAEGGVPGYEVDGWYGLLAPRGTPRPVIERFNRELSAAMAPAEMKERLLASGVEANPGPPEALRAVIERDIAKWAKVFKAAALRIE